MLLWPYNHFFNDRSRAVIWLDVARGQDASLVLPCSNLSFFGSKCTVLKKVPVTLLGLFGAPRSNSAPPGNCAPLTPPLVTPLDRRKLRQIRPRCPKT